MISSNPPKQNHSQDIFPILSINKFAWLIGIPRDEIEKIADDTEYFYRPFKKKTGDKERTIDNPQGLLKNIQTRINKNIFSKLTFPDFIIGGIKGRQPNEHPEGHINKPIVITLDIKDCFPSITNEMIFNIWHKQIGSSSEVARLATKLTTRNGHLPLGAPTSGCLANLALLNCLKSVSAIAKKYGYISQYVDDLAFSGENIPEEFITEMIKEFSKNKFVIKRSKIKVMYSNNLQIVTKKVVNKKVSLPRSERNKIRAALNELTKMDFQDPLYIKQYRSLKGRIINMKPLHPTLAKRMLENFNTLKNPDIK